MPLTLRFLNRKTRGLESSNDFQPWQGFTVMCRVKIHRTNLGVSPWGFPDFSEQLGRAPLLQIRVLHPLSGLSLSSVTFWIFMCKQCHSLTLFCTHGTAMCFSGLKKKWGKCCCSKVPMDMKIKQELSNWKQNYFFHVLITRPKCCFALTWSLTGGICTWQNFVSLHFQDF